MEHGIEPVVRALEQRPEVVAVYLYGSQARAEAGPLSDIDVGIVLEQPWFELLGPARQARIAADLMELATRAAPQLPLDVVLLDAAHPIAAWEAARAGRLLLCRDRRAVDDFVLRSLHRYDDWQRLHRLEMGYVRGRLGLAVRP